ncbi:P-loop NTPase fold protein [Sorangium sp. So ce118]
MALDPAFDDLVEACASGELILFAGAGVVAAAGLPAFRQLAEAMADQVLEAGADEGTVRHIHSLAETRNHTGVLAVSREFLGRAEFERLVERRLDDRGVDVPPVVAAIAELGPRLRAVLTTNMDSLLDRALEGQFRVVQRVTPDTPADTKVLLKLHGSVADPSTWVLLPEDEKRAMYADPAARSYLTRLISRRPMLFVGAAMQLEQPWLRAILDLSGGQGVPRFALLPVEGVTPPLRRQLGEDGIRLLGYPNETGRHEGVAELLRSLREAAPPVKAPRQNESTARETGAVIREERPAPPASPANPPGIDVPPFQFDAGATRVLDAALQIRSQRKEVGAWLTSSALLFALFETARRPSLGEAAVLGALIPERALPWGPYQDELSTYLKGPLSLEERPDTRVARELAMVSRSPNLVNLFAAAASLATSTSGAGVIGARHLLGTLLIHRPATRISNSAKRLADMGVDIAALRKELLAHVEANHGQDDIAAWRQALRGEQARPPDEHFLPGYSADDTEGNDVLDLQDEIDGFASVIASKDLIPPLSIGLFGSWGAGKSFFMRKLREAVAELTDASGAGTPGYERYHESVVPIEFNAWHYAEANLWASLVDHIFQSLSEYLFQTAKIEKERVEKLFNELETSRRIREEADQELIRARSERAAAEEVLTERVKHEQERASSLKRLLSLDLWKNITVPEDARKQVSVAADALGLAQLKGSARDLKRVIDEARTAAGRARLLGSSLLLRPSSYWVLLAFFLALPLVAFGVSELLHDTSVTEAGRTVTSAVSTISVFLGGVVAWAKKRIDVASKALDDLKSADEAISKQLEAEEKKHRGKVEAAEQELEKAHLSVTTAERRVAQADERVRAAERALEETRPERQIARFIQERVGSDDYRKHLGIVAMVRRDFARLSDLMAPGSKEAWAERAAGLPPAAADLPRIDRIVLYIDDLDRCPPQRVVEVLEAVHLLLAFKLFVVVVGVDSRWISGSLLHHYPRLLQSDIDGAGDAMTGAAACPHDYLEKIFQIPFWVRSMDGAGAFRLIAGLLAPCEERRAAAPAAQPNEAAQLVQTPAVVDERRPEPAPSDAVASPVAPAPEGTAAPPETPAREAGRRPQARAEERTGTAAIRAVRPVEIDPFEVEFIQGLSPFIGRSPRRVKRFLNIYRIVKASLPQEALPTFLKRGGVSGDYQAVLVLLAMLTGAPRVAPGLFGQIASQPPGTRLRALLDTLRSAPLDDEQGNALGALELYAQAQGEGVTLADLVRWAPQIGRYSFAAVAPARATPPGVS